MFSTLMHASKPDPSIVFEQFKFFPVIMIFFVAGLFGWLWSIAIGFQQQIPENIKMKINRFRIFFFIPLIYIVLISFGISILLNNLPDFIEKNSQPNMGIIGGLMIILVPLHLFSMFCIFHTLYFVAKTYKTVELQRETTFSDFVGEFLMLWFYPIGIWIIQPKINSIVDGTTKLPA